LILVLLDARGQVTRGFLKLTTVSYLAIALLAALVLVAAPLSAYQRHYGWPGAWTQSVHVTFLTFLAATAWYSVGLFRHDAGNRRARLAAGLTAAVCVLAIVGLLGALAGSPVGAGAIGLAFLATAIAVGAVTTGMLLGHWYLVTPALTSAPLQWTISLLFLVLTIQAIAFPAALSAATTGESSGLIRVVRDYSVVSVLWALAGVAMPLVAVGLAWLTCRLRSFMSTTGLLYLAMASVLGSQILGAELFLLVAAG